MRSTVHLAPLRRALRRRARPQGQPGLRVRRPAPAGGRRRRRRRRARRRRLQHRGPADPPARRASPTDDLLEAGRPARSTAPTTGSPSWSRRTRRSTARAPPPRSRSSTAHRLGDRPHRRQPRLPAARRHAAPAHHRPHVRADAHRRGPDHRGGGAHPPAPQPDPAGRRRRARGRPRPVPRRPRGRRPAAAVQRRRSGVARRRPDRRHPGHRHASTTPRSSWSAPPSRPARTDNVTCVVADVVEADDRGRRPGPAAGRRGRRPAAARRSSRGIDAASSAATAPATPASSSRCRPRSPTASSTPTPATRSTPRSCATRRGRRARFAGPGGCSCSPCSLGLVWVGVAAGWLRWTQDQYYVGRARRHVAIVVTIYRGLHGRPARVVDHSRHPLRVLPNVRRSADGSSRLPAPGQVPRRATRAPTSPRADAPSTTVRRTLAADAHAAAAPTRRDADGGVRRGAEQPRSAMTLLGSSSHRRRRGAELFLLRARLRRRRRRLRRGRARRRRARCRPTSSRTAAGWPPCRRCHVVVRLRRAVRRPGAAAVVAALNGLGLAVIHRLDLAYEAPARRHDFAQQQLIWMTARAWCCSSRSCWSCATTGGCRRSPTPPGSPRSCCCCCRWCPGIGTTINGARIWISVGPFSFQPGEVAKVLLVVFFAGYLVLHRDALALAGRRLLGHRPAPRPRPRPDPGDVAGQPRRAGLPARPRLVACCSSASSWSCSTSPPSGPAGSSSAALLFLAGAFLGYLLFGHVQDRVDGWLDPFATTTSPGSGQIVEAMYGMAWGGLVGRGLGQG